MRVLVRALARRIEDFLQKELARREARDQQFRADKDPIPENKRNALLPLRYYPPDPSYSVAGRAAPRSGAAGRADADLDRHHPPVCSASACSSSRSRARA